jgi:hypothetical protein
MPYGRTILASSTPYPTQVSADGNPQYRAGGITLDLTTIPAASGSDVTLADGSVITAGEQYMRYGQILCRITSGASTGKYGPYKQNASDGRQTMTRGKCFILDQTWLLNPAGASFAGLGATDTIGGVFDGGLVWQDRLLIDNPASNNIDPDIADFLTAFPAIRFQADNAS